MDSLLQKFPAMSLQHALCICFGQRFRCCSQPSCVKQRQGKHGMHAHAHQPL